MGDVLKHEDALQGVMGTSNASLLTKPQIKETLQSAYPILVVLYALLIVAGSVLNVLVLGGVIWRRLHRQPTCCLIANLAFAHILECCLALPLTLGAILIQNWVFGSFLCYVLPMLQDIPMHVSVLSFLLIALDRYRFLKDPSKPRIPGIVCSFGTWLTAVCIVLPYPIYSIYIDLGAHFDYMIGVGLCIVNLTDDMQYYIRCIFVMMYIMPLTFTAYLHVLIARDLKLKENPVAVVLYETRNKRSRSTRSSSGASLQAFRYRDENQYFSYRPPTERPSHYDLYHAELDLPKEKRTQKYLIAMASAYGVFVFPLNVLRIARLYMSETYANTYQFDLTFAAFVWVGFLPTCTMPLLVASWIMSRSEKERVRGYFRFSNRKLPRDCQRSVSSDNNPDLDEGQRAATANSEKLSQPHPHQQRAASVGTASTAITSVSPPPTVARFPPAPACATAVSPPPSPRRPLQDLPVPQPLIESNLLKHDLMDPASPPPRLPIPPKFRPGIVPAFQSSPSTISSTSSSANTNSSSSYGVMHNPFLSDSSLQFDSVSMIAPSTPSVVQEPLIDTVSSKPLDQDITRHPLSARHKELGRLPSLHRQEIRRNPDHLGCPHPEIEVQESSPDMQSLPPRQPSVRSRQGSRRRKQPELPPMVQPEYPTRLQPQPPRYFTFDHVVNDPEYAAGQRL